MKELSIEEKAKRYDEAFKVAKSNYETIVQMDNDCTFAKKGIVNTFHHIFPELEESDDEMIRKRLMEWVEEFRKLNPTNADHNAECSEALAWLEKLGELSIYNTPSREVILAIWDLGNEWKELTGGSISTKYDTQLTYIQKHWQESEYYLRAMQDEHKPAFEMKTPEESLGIDSDTYNKIVDECVYGEQNPAWSEEDETMITDLSVIVHTYFSEISGIPFKYDLSEDKIRTWLKSLRPQSQWKPSDVQIEALETTLYTNMSRNDERYSVLSDFVAELKKLRKD